jgi:hypothetical protein
MRINHKGFYQLFIISIDPPVLGGQVRLSLRSALSLHKISPSHTHTHARTLAHTCTRPQDVVDAFDGKYSYSIVKGWLKPATRDKILAADTRGRLGLAKRAPKSATRGVHHPKADRAVYQLYKQRRARGRRVSSLWLRKTYGAEVRARGLNTTTKSSRGWLCKFLSRHRISYRKRKNQKSVALTERLAGTRQWHAGLKALVQDVDARRLDPTKPVDPVQGRFLYANRFNFDEVPLAFIPGQTHTYADKGSKTVTIRSPGSGALTKRLGTLVVLVAGDGAILRPTVIFRGKGVRITNVERQSWHPDVTVLWQAKAWMDDVCQMEYARQVLGPVFKERGLAKGGSQEGLLLMDNLHAHRSATLKAFVKQRNTLCWYHTAGDTDIQQVVDAGSLGAIIKRYYNTAQDSWLDTEANLERWEANSLTASERRVLVTHWVAEACARVATSVVRKGFLKTGCLMSCDTSNDHAVRVDGAPDYEFLSAVPPVSVPDPDSPAAANHAEVSGESDDDSSAEVDEAAADDEGDEGDEGDADGDEEYEMDTLESCIPVHLRLVVEPPAALGGALVGRQIVFRWGGTGWARGVLAEHYPLGRGADGINYDVDYPFDPEGKDARGHRLRLEHYSSCKDAPVASWALLEPRPK